METNRTSEEIARDIIDSAYGFIVEKLQSAGIECDTDCTDKIFYKDEVQKAVFVINLFQTKCVAYGGSGK